MLADLSEAGYGVTLASEVKYGYAVEGNVMRYVFSCVREELKLIFRLSMLRSATAPDPEQDRGEHRFSFAIMPHAGRLLESGTYKKAMRFINNVSIRTIADGANTSPLRNPFEIGGSESIILDTVKRGENDEKLGETTIIIRLYESLGGRSRGILQLQVLFLSWEVR